jgi:hypothetical protein
MLEYYEGAIETDMNRHAKQTGKPMDDTFAHHDLTRILARDVNAGALAGMLAAAILREIERKKRGGRRR